MASEKKYFVFQDLEAVSETKVAAIGIFVGDEKGIKKRKQEWWFKGAEKNMDAKCKEEFWDKQPHLQKKLKEATQTECEAICDYVKVWDRIPDELGAYKQLVLGADNPEFDFGLLNTYVEKHLNRLPLRYTKEGNYRSIKDFSDAVWEMGFGKTVDDAATTIQPHDHNPSNDAEHNYISHLICLEIFKRFKEQLGDQMNAIVASASNDIVKEITKNRQAVEKSE
jgi:hypothetical protein